MKVGVLQRIPKKRMLCVTVDMAHNKTLPALCPKCTSKVKISATSSIAGDI